MPTFTSRVTNCNTKCSITSDSNLYSIYEPCNCYSKNHLLCSKLESISRYISYQIYLICLIHKSPMNRETLKHASKIYANIYCSKKRIDITLNSSAGIMDCREITHRPNTCCNLASNICMALLNCDERVCFRNMN